MAEDENIRTCIVPGDAVDSAFDFQMKRQKFYLDRLNSFV